MQRETHFPLRKTHITIYFHLRDAHTDQKCCGTTSDQSCCMCPWAFADASFEFSVLGCHYLPSSGIALENSACCSVRCCSISSSFSWKCWQELFITSISLRVHYTEKQEDIPLYFLSLSISTLSAFEADSPNLMGLPLTCTTGTL